MKCETCKFWERLTFERDEDGDYFIENKGCYSADDLKANPARWGTCRRIPHGFFEFKGGDEKAFTVDASDYQSNLHTRDDFGCVLHDSIAP